MSSILILFLDVRCDFVSVSSRETVFNQTGRMSGMGLTAILHNAVPYTPEGE